MKKNEKNENAHGKGLPHGKGTFVVSVFFAVRWPSLCRALFLCRALASLFTVLLFFVVRSAASLPCADLCRAFYGAFAVPGGVAVHHTTAARQRYLCLVLAHGSVCWHGKEHFSGSGCSSPESVSRSWGLYSP
jgi:hypothetical protein